MKKLFLTLLTCLVGSIILQALNPGVPDLIPKPVKMKLLKGHCKFGKEVEVYFLSAQPEIRKIAGFLKEKLERQQPVTLRITSVDKLPKNFNGILLSSKQKKLPDEGYSLKILENSVVITGGNDAGLFYGVQSFLQLALRGNPMEVQEKEEVVFHVPCMEIKDFPRYPYRGMHLDVSRHFFSKEFVKRYIDLLSMYKLNTFHWHLTDENGWRIEIKKYPELTKTGAWRVDREDLPWTERPAQLPGEKTEYGGFYTQEEIREVVEYAKERYITIIPEIEMPAHSVEVLAAYPRLSCSGGPFTVPPGSYWPNSDILCAGNDSTFIFLEDVLSEVISLFPSTYIHIGGDEADKAQWKKCLKCQTRIEKENLKDEKELQSYFIKRIEKFLSSKGRKVIGWDEILEGGLPAEATVMSWRGVEGGIEAAKLGHDVIMTPNTYCYFDYYQANPKTEPKAIGGLLTLKKVYSFEPTPPGLSGSQQKHILGAQGNLWTEYIATEKHAEYMAIPRMLALAEVTWTPSSMKDWTDFRRRLNFHYKKFDNLKVNYSKGYFGVGVSTYFDTKSKKLFCKLESEQPDLPVLYTLSGNDPDSSSSVYSGPFEIRNNCYLKAGIFYEGKFKDPFTERTIVYHQAVGKKVKYLSSYSHRYTAGGDEALNDGLRGTSNHREGGWQGYLGNDLEVVIDLGEIRPVRTVVITFLQNEASWIFLPDSVIFSLSTNGKKFHSINELANPVKKITDRPVIRDFSQLFPDTKARYIKIRAKNRGTCPEWHEGAGQKCWIFADEIVVY